MYANAHHLFAECCDFGLHLLCAGHVPFVFNASSLRPGEHTVLITARGSNGATATSSLTFQINGADGCWAFGVKIF